LWNRNEDYAVLYKDIDSTESREAITKTVIQNAIKDFATAGLTSNGQGEEFEMYGFPSTDIKFQNSMGGKYTARLVVADTRLYVLLVGKQMGFPDDESAKRFFNSFVVTDENLIKGEERGRVALLGKVLAEDLFREQELVHVTKLGKVLTENLLKRLKKEKPRVD
jgi:hypothetical protein